MELTTEVLTQMSDKLYDIMIANQEKYMGKFDENTSAVEIKKGMILTLKEHMRTFEQFIEELDKLEVK